MGHLVKPVFSAVGKMKGIYSTHNNPKTMYEVHYGSKNSSTMAYQALQLDDFAQNNINFVASQNCKLVRKYELTFKSDNHATAHAFEPRLA